MYMLYMNFKGKEISIDTSKDNVLSHLTSQLIIVDISL